MVDILANHKSKYVKKSDWDETLIATVKKVYVERMGMGPQQEDKNVLYLEELEQGIVLANAHERMLADILGRDTATWAGTRIELRPGFIQGPSGQVSSITFRAVTESTGDEAASADAPF